MASDFKKTTELLKNRRGKAPLLGSRWSARAAACPAASLPAPRELSGSHTAQEARTAPWDPGRRDAGPGSQLPGEDRGAG